MDWNIVFFALQLAVISTVFSLFIAIPISLWFVSSTKRLNVFMSTIVAFPLLLPSIVLTFYSIQIMKYEKVANIKAEEPNIIALLFSLPGLALASILFSLPFVVQPIKNIFQLIGSRPFEAAATLRTAPFESFCRILLPLAKSGIISAAFLGFAYSLLMLSIILMISKNFSDIMQIICTQIYYDIRPSYFLQIDWFINSALILSIFILVMVYWFSLNQKSTKIYSNT